MMRRLIERRQRIIYLGAFLTMMFFCKLEVASSAEEQKKYKSYIIEINAPDEFSQTKSLSCLYADEYGDFASAEDQALLDVLKAFDIDVINPIIPQANKVSDDCWLLEEHKFNNVYVIELNTPQENICPLLEDFTEACHPDYTLTPSMIPDDPYYNSYGSMGDYEDAWGLKMLNAQDAWDITQGSGVVVAVVDTGVEYTHPDLADNIWTNEGEIPDNGIDDDGNGYIDDILGWDFSRDNNNPMDSMSHGTSMAGIISAVTNNGYGSAGLAHSSKIMAVKADYYLGEPLTRVSELIEGINYAVENGADIINMSFAPSERCASIPLLEMAVEWAWGNGAFIVVAAGNKDDDIIHYSPANSPYAFTVGAIDINKQRAIWNDTVFHAIGSNYGAGIDVVAPGEMIAPLYSKDVFTKFIVPDRVLEENYFISKGTSGAAALVSSMAALLISQDPELTPDELAAIIRATAEDLGTAGVDTEFGYGLINPTAALAMDGVPTATILSPADRANTRKEFVDIELEIKTPLVQYQLSFKHKDDVEWTYFELNDITTDGTIIEQWDLRGLPLGNYLLRLDAESMNGFVAQDLKEIELFYENTAPSLDPITPTYHYMAGETYQLQFTAFDPEDDTLTFAAQILPTGASLTADGLFTWTPAEEGTYDLMVTVSDGEYMTLSDLITITVEEPNTPPEMILLRNVFDRYFVWAAQDEEDRTRKLRYSYSVDDQPWSDLRRRSYVTVKKVIRKFDLAPGLHTFKVKVYDTKGATDEMQLEFTIDKKDVKKAKKKKRSRRPRLRW